MSKDSNGFEILRSGVANEINILSEVEQENLLGGYKVIHCQEGYSIKKDNTVTCACGYSYEEKDDDGDDDDGD